MYGNAGLAQGPEQGNGAYRVSHETGIYGDVFA
jgi:hypothetical protein